MGDSSRWSIELGSCSSFRRVFLLTFPIRPFFIYSRNWIWWEKLEALRGWALGSCSASVVRDSALKTGNLFITLGWSMQNSSWLSSWPSWSASLGPALALVVASLSSMQALMSFSSFLTALLTVRSISFLIMCTSFQKSPIREWICLASSLQVDFFFVLPLQPFLQPAGVSSSRSASAFLGVLTMLWRDFLELLLMRLQLWVLRRRRGWLMLLILSSCLGSWLESRLAPNLVQRVRGGSQTRLPVLG